MGHVVIAMIALAPEASWEPRALTEALSTAGFPVLGGRADGTACFVGSWISDEGPRAVRLSVLPGVPSGRLGPRGPDAEELARATHHLRVELVEGPDDLLDADLMVVQLAAAIRAVVGAVAMRLDHLEAWLHPDDWGSLAAQDDGVSVPAELVVDLEIGPLGPEAVGVLSSGLERYGLREVLVVSDRDRLVDAWSQVSTLVEERLLDIEPSVEVSSGPHPRRPGEVVDVAFVDDEHP